jgi:hypothetical protein
MSDVVNCRYCGKEYKSRGSCWKHEQKCEESTVDESDGLPSPPAEEVPSPPSSSSDNEDSTPPSTTSSNDPEWMSFDMGFDDTVTEVMPTPLKLIAKDAKKDKKKKLNQAEQKALGNLNVQLLKSGLTIGDSLLTKYGRAVTLDEDYLVKHSEADKDMVAEAQWRYLESKGVIPSNVINEGVIAAGMTAWYFGKPAMEIRKRSKVPLLKGVGKRMGFLGRLPLIGRIFKRRRQAEEVFVNVEDLE